MRTISLIYIVMGMLIGANAFALTTLKQVQVTDGSQVDLLFDTHISQSQIKTEFFNDIIQISLNNVSVYPAKISSVAGSDLTKIFAYQYAPKLVRCRLSVKDKAENYQDRLHVRASGKVLTIKIAAPAIDKLTIRSAHAATAPAAKEPSIEEKVLLEKVIKSTPAAPVAQASQQTRLRLTGGNERAPRPMRTFTMLGIVLGMFGFLIIGLKKVRIFQGKKDSRVRDLISRFARTGLGRGEKIIEVVATHYLGPKQSIAVVKVAGRLLVLGVSNESMNLITQLSEDSDENEVNLKEALSPTGPTVFADLLNHEKVKPDPSQAHGMAGSIRAQIKKRIEGMKPL